MSQYRNDISQWFDKNINNCDYVMIDAPWNYVRCESSVFWDKISYMDIFQNCKTNYMFVWTTVEGLGTLMAQQIESDYELKALMPWLCSNIPINVDSSYKICREYLAVFCKPYASFIKTCTANVILEPNDACKPRKWEANFIQSLTDKGLVGRYLSPKGFITFKTETHPQAYRKDLF